MRACLAYLTEKLIADTNVSIERPLSPFFFEPVELEICFYLFIYLFSFAKFWQHKPISAVPFRPDHNHQENPLLFSNSDVGSFKSPTKP